MKSIFLATLMGALVSSVTWAQTKKTVTPPPSPRATTTTLPVAAKPTAQKSSFDRFYDRLSISYFGQYLSSPLDRFHPDYAITSPQFEVGQGDRVNGEKACDNCDDYAQNIFHMVTFKYNYGGGNSFFIQPRVTTFLGKARAYNNTLFLLEDFLVGFNTPIYSSQDKKFAWNMRPAVRLPTSLGSRQGDNGAAGDYTYQPDISNSFSYTFNEQWSISYALGNRFYIYEDRYNVFRHRITNGLELNQKISSNMSLSYNYEYWWQNDKRRESLNNQATSYKKVWQNAYIGLATDLTPKLGFTPVIGAYPDDPNFGLRSAYVSAIVTYSIK